MNLFKKTYYETDKITKDQFVDFAKWLKDHKELVDSDSEDVLFQKYLQSKNIAIIGELHIYENVDKRNATKEMWLAIGGGISAIIIALILVSLIPIQSIDKFITWLSHLIF